MLFNDASVRSLGTNVSYVMDMGDGTVYMLLHPFDVNMTSSGLENCTNASGNVTANSTCDPELNGTTDGEFLGGL